MAITAQNLISRCEIYTNYIGTRVEATDWFDFFTTSIREIRRSRTFPWQKMEQDLELFTNVFTYQLPDDFDSIIKLKEALFTDLDHNPFELYTSESEFFSNINSDFALAWSDGKQYLLSRKEGAADMVMDGFEDGAINYLASGDVSNLISDNNNYREGAASLRFDITDNSHASTIERSLATPLDLTDYINKGKVFLYVCLPTVVASVTIKYGTDASNYYTVTVSINAVGNSFSKGWNLLKFDMNGATVVGAPNYINISYYAVILDNTGVSDTDFRLDGLYFRLPTIFVLPYNSKNIVTNSLGVRQEAVIDYGDIILGDISYEDVIMWMAVNKAARYKLKDQDLMTLTDFENPTGEVKRAITEFNRRYPSQEAPLQSNYYKRFRTF